MIRSKTLLAALLVLILGAFVAKRLLTPSPAPQTAAQVSGPLPGSALAACLRNGHPTLADFGAGWCKPCKQQAPVLDAAAQQYRGKANVVYVDTEAFSAIADSYGIKAIPTQLFFDRKGKEVSRHLGYYPPEAIAAELTKLGVR